MNQQTLFIADIFKSIQGEGPKLGTPSIFVRLGVCNLQCTWCDTPYTWKKGLTDYRARDFNWILNEIKILKAGTNIKNVVITGGEPLLQQNQLAELLQNKIFQNMEIEFETNGSMPLLPSFKNFIEKRNAAIQHKRSTKSHHEKNLFPISFNISPKLADSENKPYKVQIYPNSIFKFVYLNQKSENLIDEFLSSHMQLKTSAHSALHTPLPIFIMPEGGTVDAMAQKYDKILQYCVQRGFRFAPRLHIYLFGNKRAT